MTQANEIDSRLNLIEALTLEIAAANLRHDRAIDQNKAAITRHDEEFSRINNAIEQLTTETRASINDLVNMIGTLGQNADRHWESIQEMQAEVRGLQTENRRILEHLEQHMSNGHGEQ
jgi:predicted  nucleic acid-binding Zn-ribbon protein